MIKKWTNGKFSNDTIFIVSGSKAMVKNWVDSLMNLGVNLDNIMTY